MRRIAAAIVALAALLVVFETWPPSARLYGLPEAESSTAWIPWVVDQVRSDEAILFLPFPDDRKAESFLPTAQWMYFQMWHGRPLANGYSALLPREYGRLQAAMANFPSPTAVDALREAGIACCALDQRRGASYDAEALRALGFTLIRDDVAAGLQFWRVPTRVVARPV